MLLAAANDLRHLPAHGALDIPEADAWGPDEPVISKSTELLLHAPRLATRGLALSIQMLLLTSAPQARLSGVRTPLHGWQVRQPRDEWDRHDAPDWRARLEQAHLHPPVFELDDQLTSVL